MQLNYKLINSSVVSEPRLGSFWLELLAKKLGSAQLAQYPKKLVLRKFVKTSLSGSREYCSKLLEKPSLQREL